MTLFDPKPFIGRQLIDVEVMLKQLCGENRWSFSVLDPTFKTNIDAGERDRMNVYVDDDFKIQRIYFG